MNIKRSHISEQTTSPPTERAQAGRTCAAPAKHPAEPQLRSALSQQQRAKKSCPADTGTAQEAAGHSAATAPGHHSLPQAQSGHTERAQPFLQSGIGRHFRCHAPIHSLFRRKEFFFFLQSNSIASNSQVLLT